MSLCLTWSTSVILRRSKMRFRLRQKELKKSLISASVVALVLGVYLYIIRGQLEVSETLFLTGILFFTAAMWRMVRLLGLFDLTFYSMKKMTGKLEMDFHEYTEQNPYTESFLELLLVSAAFILISVVL